MAAATSAKPNLRLDHIAVWTGELDKTSQFLTEIVGWKRHPMEFGVSAEDTTTGGMEGVFFDANGIWLELILPTSPGPGMDILDERGSGAIIEINFEPADYDATLAEMKAKGIAMENMDGTPLGADGGTIKEGVRDGDAIDEQGQRIAYWPKTLSCGSTVEIYEQDDDDENALLTIRDRMWAGQRPDPETPRADHISVLVKDLEKAASFYTDVMGLQRHPQLTDIEAHANGGLGGLRMAFIDTNGVWLELVQPTGPGPFADLLEEQGDGYLAELICEVDDLAAYSDAMQKKGVELVDAQGRPFRHGAKYFVVEPFGTRGAYFPRAAAGGMAIQLVERGPRETDILHRRDDTWG